MDWDKTESCDVHSARFWLSYKPAQFMHSWIFAKVKLGCCPTGEYIHLADQRKEVIFLNCSSAIDLCNMVLIFMAEPDINKFHQIYHQLIPEIILSDQQMNFFTLFRSQTFRGVCLLCRYI